MEDRGVSAAPPSTVSSQIGSQPTQRSIFGEDGKLSSASAAASLKYAKPQDLPSFPSAGLQMSSAGAAASLASSHSKNFEYWKPGTIPAANKAALLASDYTMEPLWQPSASAAGSKAAMMAAHNNTTKKPSNAQESAALAKPVTVADVNSAIPADTHKRALMAATASTNRQRSGSLPSQAITNPTPDSQWALKAATKSHKDGTPPISRPFASGDPGFEAARIQNMAKNNIDRRLFTSAPPVAIEVQEKNRQDTLRASAVAMAQQMYAIQQRQIDEAAGKVERNSLAASRARRHTLSSSSGSVGDDVPTSTNTSGYENLEEAARKLAQARLAKIHDEHAEYRQYYGQTTPNRNRLSMRMRPPATNPAFADDSDEESSRKIKTQMSIFQSKLAEVDSKKRQQDRDNLLQIAHRNVDAQIRKMDDKVFQDTGKASPAQMEEWQKSAREKAQKDSDERMKYAGKVHIGGGKYFEQSELDAIARARLQPTLDDITEKAEQQRARDEEIRVEKARQVEAARVEKARQAEVAAAQKQVREQQKQEERARKEEERARKEEEKRKLRESKEIKPGRWSTMMGRGAPTAVGASAAETDAAGTTVVEPTVAEADMVEPSEADTDTAESAVEEMIATEPAVVEVNAAETGTVATTTDTLTPTEEPTTASVAPATTEVTGEEAETVHDLVTAPTPAALATTTITSESPTTARSELQTIAAVQTGTKPIGNRSSVDEEKDIVGASPTASSSRMKSWMKGRFRSKSNAQKGAGSMPMVSEATTAAVPTTKESGTAGLRADSMRDVAMAGRTTNETEDMYGGDREVSAEGAAVNAHTGRRSSSISSLSSTYSIHEPVVGVSTEQHDLESENRGRQGFKQRLMNRVKPSKNKSRPEAPLERAVSTTTEDEFEEARDTFEEEKLAPPPPLSSVHGEGSGAKASSPRGSRERSRFTEEL